MKPMGKSLKSAFSTKEPMQGALDKFLVGYRSTPHVATGIAPGNYMFRDGYRADFPRKPPVLEKDIDAAKLQNEQYKLAIQKRANSSVKRKKDNVCKDDLVLIRNPNRIRKFDTKYLPTPYLVLLVEKYGVFIERTTDKRQFYLHKDDITQYNAPEESENAQSTSTTQTLWYTISISTPPAHAVDKPEDHILAPPLDENDVGRPKRNRRPPVRYPNTQ